MRVRPYETRREYQAAWRKKNRSHIRSREQAKYIKNREHILDTVRNRKYGITNEWVDETFNSQDGNCPICATQISKRSAHIDHDHKSGAPRGMLCSRCNVLLGVLEDRNWVSNAEKYLKKYGEVL